jgi:hypothetical protein
MTIAGAIELALADVIRNKADIGAGTILRCWQTLTDEQAIAADGARMFPMIEVRCGPPATADQTTRYCDVVILCGTYNEDDKTHLQIAQLYEGVQIAVDALHAQSIARTGADLSLFSTRISSEYSGSFSLGGITLSGSEPPYEDGGVNFIGVNMRVHFI